jgi:hypothetical protein
MINKFPHKPPNGYCYKFEKFNSKLIAIWLHHNCNYDYKLGKPIKTIWGFFSPTKNEYYSPINSSKVGSIVDINQTTPYTAMQINLTPLEVAFL